MLAQNAFAEFLKMDSGARAELLEKITGGELYADISREVFARHSAQVGSLKAMQATVDGIQVLTEDEVAALKESVKVVQVAVDDAGKLAQKYEAALQWLELIEKLVNEAGQLSVERTNLEADVDGFRQDAARLELAETAARLAGEWQSLKNARDNLVEQEKRAADLAENLPGLREAEVKADLAVKDAAAAVLSADAAVQQNVPVIRKARELDGDIRGAANQLGEIRLEVTTKAAAVDELKVALTNIRGQIADSEAILGTVNEQLDKNACDATLESRLGEVRLKLDGLDTDRRKLSVLRDALNEYTEKLNGIGNEIEGLRTRRKELQDSEAQAERDLKGLQKSREDLLFGHDVSWWDLERDRLAKLVADLGRASEAVEVRTKVEEDLKLLADQDENARKSIDECERGLAENGKIVAILDDQLVLLNKAKNLQVAVMQLSEQREKLLRPGVECPLCGSLDHPWAAGNVPTDDETDTKMAETMLRLNDLRAASGELDRKKSALQAGIRSNQVAREKAEQALRKSQDILSQNAVSCGFDATASGLSAILGERAENAATAQAGAAVVINAVLAVDTRLADASRTYQDCRERLIQADNDIQKAEVRKDAAAESITKMVTETAQLETRLSVVAAEVAGLVAVWGIGPDRLDHPDAVLQELDRRRQAWSDWQSKKNSLEKDLQSLRAGIAARQDGLDRDVKDLEKARKRLEDAEATLKNLQARRAQVLSEPDVDAFEAGLAKAARMAMSNRDIAKQSLSSIQSDLKSVLDQIDENAKAIAAGRVGLGAAEAEFSAALSRRGFADEAAFVASRLSDAEIELLAERRAKLDTRKVAIETKTAENARRMAEERDRALTDLDKATVRERLDQAKQDLAAGNRQLGELKNRMDMDNAERERARDQLGKLQEQQVVVRRWEQLNKLIGSSDGKNFRQFAQGITFEHLIHDANKHLKVLSDRYSLQMAPADKHGNASLDLDVVDDWQGGDARTVRNLSGGETFIVSLALALGLSSLASRRIRIDSFFMDEGFGTLDQEALNSAMDALGELRRDGKLIGIISHVEALKQRIVTRIDVSRQPGGRSTISGPGVERVV
ncbi:MAG TPA: SbcC/MukB-like Walker B domain-containing protein [Myxococcota bacterium]|nr:SbcC/MukB-like Walker B domain-containing protein [Myxococcota bacterium]